MESESRACTIRHAALRFGLVFWGGVFLFAGLAGAPVGTAPNESVAGTVIRYALCPLIAAGMAMLLFRLHERVRLRALDFSLPLLVGASLALSLLAAPLWVALGHGLDMAFQGGRPVAFAWKTAHDDIAYGAALFFGWSCLFMTLLLSFEIHERELKLAAMREEAMGAQMRALRYQVNPHFLFNTLNSVAGLIEEGDGAGASKMVLCLSEFLRTTLSLDPMSDVPLSHELALQGGYLAIERERFSDRMAVRIEVPEEVRDALVPSLILQPLIENAIKHGVNATTGQVEIALLARRAADRLHLVVENDMPRQPAPKPPGMGMGLRNVAERLRTRFADQSTFDAGPIAPGRYRASIDLPWRHA